MASQSVLKLKVDDKEYSAGLKNAQQGLQALRQSLEQQGRTFSDVGKNVVDYVREIGNMESTAKNSRSVLRDMSQTLTDLTIQYRELSDAEKSSPFGKALAASIEELTNRAGDISDAMGDVQASITNMASDTRAFDQVAGGISLMTSGFQTAVGAANLLGIEMGNEEKVLATLASAMSITNGLQTVQNLLQSQSALMMGVQAARASIAAAAQTALAAATGSATIAQKAFNLVAKANPYVLLATAVAAVGTALYAFASASGKAEKEAEELAKAEEEAKKKADEARNAFVNASGEAMNSASRLSSLQTAYMRANSEIEKTSILRQAQEQFKKLGIECKTLSDTQNMLVKNGASVIEMIRLQGTVAALSAIRMEAFKNSFKMLMENGYSASAAAALAGYNKEVVELDGQITQMQSRIQGIRESLPSSGSRSPSTTAAGSSSSVVAPAGSVAALNAEIKDLQQQQSLVTNTSAWKAYAEQIREVQLRVKELKSEMGFESLQGMKGMSISGTATDAVKAMQNNLKTQKLDVKIVQPKEKADVKASEILGSISSAVGNMASGIEGIGIEIPKDIKNMLGVLNSITMILTSIEAFQKVGAFLGIFAHGGVVKAASGYTVPGRTFSGDMIPARLNAGELVLNQAQAGVIASALQDRDFSGGMGSQPYVEGEKIFLGMNNTSKRMGKGEIVTTSMLRRMGLMN